MNIDPDFDRAVTNYLQSLTHLHSPYGHSLPVCRICRGPTGTKQSSAEHWELCWECRGHRRTPGVAPAELAENTRFIIYALEDRAGSPDQALRDMYQYKKLSRHHTERGVIPESGQRIRTLLYVTLRDHLETIGHHSRPVDVITHVPSTSRDVFRDRRALSDSVDSALGHLPGTPPHHHLLVPGTTHQGASRRLDPDRFAVVDGTDLSGRHVLLIEDTWVTGASAQSAAVALHRSGAEQVTLLCVARMLKEQWRLGNYLTSTYAAIRAPGTDATGT